MCVFVPDKRPRTCFQGEVLGRRLYGAAGREEDGWVNGWVDGRRGENGDEKRALAEKGQRKGLGIFRRDFGNVW